jgi:hypothetical protein
MVKPMLAKNETQVMRVPSQKSDEVATMAIKGKTTLNKSLFSKLSIHKCLTAKECRKR